MTPIAIRTAAIELQKFPKLAGAADSGGEAKQAITSGAVTVNGACEKRRGCQLRPGDIVVFAGRSYRVEAAA